MHAQARHGAVHGPRAGSPPAATSSGAAPALLPRAPRAARPGAAASHAPRQAAARARAQGPRACGAHPRASWTPHILAQHCPLASSPSTCCSTAGPRQAAGDSAHQQADTHAVMAAAAAANTRWRQHACMRISRAARLGAAALGLRVAGISMFGGRRCGGGVSHCAWWWMARGGGSGGARFGADDAAAAARMHWLLLGGCTRV